MARQLGASFAAVALEIEVGGCSLLLGASGLARTGASGLAFSRAVATVRSEPLATQEAFNVARCVLAVAPRQWL